MRTRFFLLLALVVCLGVSLVAAQIDPDDIPSPPTVVPTEDDIDIPMPATVVPTEEDIDIPMPKPPATEEPLCVTGNDGQTYCTYPTMAPCYTNSSGETLCTYPTMLPSPTVPAPTLTPDKSRIVPGYWRQTRSNMNMTGTCKSAAMGVGHNPGGGGDSPTPEIPLIPIFQSSTADFLFVDGYPYPLVQSQLYSRTTTSRQLTMQNGATSGSINTSDTIEYQILASNSIAVHKIYKEEGGCTIEDRNKLELVRTDPNVVNDDVVELPTIQPSPTPSSDMTAVPEQPIPPGTYPITWTIDSGTCTDKTQPTFTEAKVDYASNGDMLLRLGDDEHTLFPVGSDDNIRYQLLSSGYQITVQVLSGVIKMDWSKIASVTNMCFKSGELSTSTTPAATPVPFIAPTATPLAATNNQHYHVTFQPDEQMCPADIQKKLPAFDGATFEKLPDGSYQLVLDGKTLIFKDQYGYATYDGSEPSKGITYQISAQLFGQGGMLGLTYVNASGAMCLAQMTLSAQ